MAKRRRKTNKKKKLTDSSRLGDGIFSEIVAIVLIAIALITVVGIFTSSNGAANLVEFFSWFMGRAVFIFPALLILTATSIFTSEEREISSISIIGNFLLLITFTSLFHASSVGNESWQIAQTGEGGGILGHIFGSMVIGLLDGVAGVIFLIAVGIIGLMLAINLKFSDLINMVKSLFVRDDKEDEQKASNSIMQPINSASEPQLKTNVPLEKSSNKSSDIPSVDSGDQILTTTADPDWQFPSIDLLDKTVDKADAGDWKNNAEIIKETLSDFKIDVQMGDINVGPRVTQYTLIPPKGVRLTKITSLDDNIALNLAASSVRIEAPIPGKRAVGIEVPNKKAATIRMRMMLDSKEWHNMKPHLSFVVGQDIAGDPVIADLGGMPHLLVAGATNSGKSVMINAILTSFLYKNAPSDLKLILVDPKQVELGLYNDIPHLLTEVITEPEKCISALKWGVAEMERRYSVLAGAGKRNIAEYNSAHKDDRMPYIVVVIDELADLMMMAARDVEALIVRLAQKARATGIHLILATQRPSVDVITGLIKANIPTRIAFTVASQVDSRTILDGAGAEKLLGAGDMLFMTPGFAKPRRVQGPLIEEREVKSVTDHVKAQRDPEYNDEITAMPVQLSGRGSILADADNDDSLYRDAVRVVVEDGKASTSYLQRRLSIGYNRAARLIDQMEEQGIVGQAKGSRPREVLITSADTAFSDEEVE